MSRVVVYPAASKKRLVLDDTLLLGQGGEARVYAHPKRGDLAVKIFHERQGPLAALREKKLRAFPAGLPPLVVTPEELVLDDQGALAGYAMRRVPGAVDVAVLAKKAARPVGNDAVLAVFRALVDALAALHARGVIAGDLNDGNVVLDGAFAPWLIDADSMQVGALPCPVAHERFLDPRLYGASLVDAPRFDAGSDAYALRVLLFQSLLCVHPYGGVHPRLATLLRRAEASWSVLRGDVQLPKSAVPFATLPDDLLHDFARCFDDGARDPVDASLLAGVRFRRCSCGVEHARSACPVCRAAVAAPAIRTSGGVHEEALLDTRGLVILARAFGGHLAWLVDEGGVVRREPGALGGGGVVLEGRPADVRFALAGDATWVACGGELVKVRAGDVVDRALTATSIRGEPVFAAGRAGLFVVEGDALVHHETRVRVGRVLEGQTALFSLDDGGAGFWLAGTKLRGFRFGADPRSFCDLELPDVAGPGKKLVDVSVAAGDDGRALFGFAVDAAGKRVHTLALVDARGRLLAQASGDPEREPMLESIHGKCLAGGRILSSSNAGVCAVDVAAGVLRTGAVFADTRPFVDATVELLPAPGGALVVVSPQSITRLRLAGSPTTRP